MPKVTVILTTQLDENSQYLRLALRGLSEQTFKDFEVKLISGAERPPECGFNFDGRLHMHHDRELDTATKKIHLGIENSESDLILLHSDDVFLSRHSLNAMVAPLLDNVAICNPFSNSDCRSLYFSDPTLFREADGTEFKLHPDMTIEDLAGWEDHIIHFPVGRMILLPVQCISFYCTMIPRVVWNIVGKLDPALEYRHNDQDFCLRARQAGIPTYVNLAPFAFHFGSRTLRTLAPESVRREASAHFIQKWQGRLS